MGPCHAFPTGHARSLAVIESSHGEQHRAGVLPVFPRAAAVTAEAPHMIPIANTNLTVGRYLISPLIRSADSGGYSASVSVKSGRGTGTHDRVLRLNGHFHTQETAHQYALDEGIAYIQPRCGAAVVLPQRNQGVE